MDCVNDFYVDSKTNELMILALIIELGCINEFYVGSDSVFINDF